MNGAHGVFAIRNVAQDINIGAENATVQNNQEEERTVLVLVQQDRKWHAMSRVAKVSA